MPESNPPTEIEALADAIDDLYVEMRRGRALLAGSAGEEALSVAQISLLEPLDGGQEVTVGTIAEHGGIRGPTATQMLKQLEARGIVRRRRATHDQRLVLVRLTKKGAAQRDAGLARLRQIQVASLSSKFSAAERAQLTKLLLYLTATIREAREAEVGQLRTDPAA